MSGIPKEIPDLGAVTQRLRQNPRFDATRAGGFSSEDYFVWSRIDGFVSIRDLLLMVGFPTDKSIGIVRKLREVGAVLVGSESPEEVAERVARAERSVTAAPPALDFELTDAESAALDEPVELTREDKRRILVVRRRARTGEHWQILGLDPGADKRAVKRAYFKLSKEFHPDRYYGKRLGSFEGWLGEIFAAVHEAFEVLSDDLERTGYERARTGRPVRDPGSQTPAEHAAELFERACDAEIGGDVAAAEVLFAAAVRVDPKSSYLRRAASFSLKVGKLVLAEEYAKKAAELRADDPSYRRLLADVYRAGGKLRQARATLEDALALKSENDILRRELEADLDEVRRALEGRSESA